MEMERELSEKSIVSREKGDDDLSLFDFV